MKFKDLKNKPWFNYAAALCIAVLLWFILSNIGSIAHVIKVIIIACTPVIAGAVIAYVLDPIVVFFEKYPLKKLGTKKIVRLIAIVITVVLVAFGLSFLMMKLIPQLTSSISGIFGKLSSYKDIVNDWLSGFNFYSESVETAVGDFFTRLSGILPNVLNWIIASINTIGSTVVNIVISAIMAIYFLIGKRNTIRWVKAACRMTLKSKYHPVIDFLKKCNHILKTYVTGSMIEALFVGLVNALLMRIFGMPYVVLVSVVVGVTNLAPTFGPIAGGAIGFILLVLEKPIFGIIFLIFTFAIQSVDGYIVKPKMFGDTLGTSSIWILICIIVFGKLFGVIGLLIAIPFAAIAQFLIRDIALRQRAAASRSAAMSAAKEKTEDIDDMETK